MGILIVVKILRNAIHICAYTEHYNALLITAEDPEYPEGLLLQRKIEYPVQLKLLPRHDHMEESDENSYQYEYITIWAYNLDDPQMLLKFFSAE